jgi:hypothetical protein
MDIWPILPGCAGQRRRVCIRKNMAFIFLVIVENLAEHRGTILRFSSAKKIEHCQKMRDATGEIFNHETRKS